MNISDKTKRQNGGNHTSGNHRWIKTIKQGVRHVIQGRGICFIQRGLHLWRASGGLAEQIDGYYEGKHTVMKPYIINIIIMSELFKLDYILDSSVNRIPYLLFCLRHYMTDAVKAYEVKARDQWLFDYPAQVSLCGTQIWWTSEVRKLQIKWKMEASLNNIQ